MTIIWQGIDPPEAEARLRSLNRRLRDLHDALQSTAVMMEARPDSLAFKLDQRSLLERKTDLQDELAELLTHQTVTTTEREELAPKSAR